jgi:hypothetical protein
MDVEMENRYIHEVGPAISRGVDAMERYEKHEE